MRLARVWPVAAALLVASSTSATTYYVNGETGNDDWDGLCEEWDGGTCGPKRTIAAAFEIAEDGDEVVLAPVTFTGDGNRDLDFAGKAITVRSVDPGDPDVVAATVIDCQANEDNRHRAFKFESGEGPDSVLTGVTIVNGRSEERR